MTEIMKHTPSAGGYIHDGLKKDLDRKYRTKFGYRTVSDENWALMFPEKEKQDSIDIMKKGYGLVRKMLDYSFKTSTNGEGSLVVEEELWETGLLDVMSSAYNTWKITGRVVPVENYKLTLCLDEAKCDKLTADLVEELMGLTEDERALFYEEFFNYRQAALEKCKKVLY